MIEGKITVTILRKFEIENMQVENRIEYSFFVFLKCIILIHN